MTITMTQTKISEMLGAYLECALWSSCDDNGIPLDLNYTIEDIAKEEIAKALNTVMDFYRIAEKYLEDCEDYGQPGHDLWLTRNHHGTGFWDREKIYGVGNSIMLTDIANGLGDCDLCIGDDSKLYFFP